MAVQYHAVLRCQLLQHPNQRLHIRQILPDILRIHRFLAPVVKAAQVCRALPPWAQPPLQQVRRLVHHLQGLLMVAVRPTLGVRHCLAMCAAAPQPFADAWCKSPASRYSRALAMNVRACSLWIATMSKSTISAVLPRTFEATTPPPPPSTSFCQCPHPVLTPPPPSH